MPATCQPVATCRTRLLLKRGVIATAVRLKMFRRSLSQLPRSNNGLPGTVTVWSVFELYPENDPMQWDHVQFAFMLTLWLTRFCNWNNMAWYVCVPEGSHWSMFPTY